MRKDLKAGLEMTLVHMMTVSSLKVHSSPLGSDFLSSIVVISNNLLACKGVKDQAESPLLSIMLEFTQLHPVVTTKPLLFSNFINLQNLMNKQYVLSNNQMVCFAQMH